MSLVLPDKVNCLLGEVPESERHPGLQLDKFSVPGDQSAQKEALKKVCQTWSDESFLTALRKRRTRVIEALPAAKCFHCKTIGPLTLHLSRTSALENAGIALHPIYGFVYFPGTGLKGMARAYAETVWLPAQTDKRHAWRQIEDVFGWAPNPDRREQISDQEHPAQVRREDENNAHSPEILAASGNVVFHDAWPMKWPKLQLDIVNNHHTEYYQNENAAPGDWESPNMVYFLAIGPGEEFEFALSKRRNDTPDALLNLAQQWLQGALTYEGLGAKTAAGYGGFEFVGQAARPLQSPARAVFETTLELVTPAFLAGPHQQAEDCDLRPATLRGLLRWWWRTMHAGYVDLPTLHRLETAIWGDTNSGSPVRITVLRDQNSPKPILVPGKSVQKDKKNRDVLRVEEQFVQQMRLEQPPNKKTTQGFFYLSYGMDEMRAGRREERKQRFMQPPGAKWRVRFTVRKGFYYVPREASGGENQDSKKSKDKGVCLSPKQILEQAQAALQLLCCFGGVGSKGRNGFGSLKRIDQEESDDQRVIREVSQAAAAFREVCRVPESPEEETEISALKHALSPLSIKTPWKNYWFTLDQLGYSIQSFAQKNKRNWIKEALGLPRKIGTSEEDGTKSRGYEEKFDEKSKRQVVWLGQKHPYLNLPDSQEPREPEDMRHAAPVHFHVDRDANGCYLIRVIAFPCRVLPDWQTSKTVLEQFLKHLENDFQSRRSKHSHSPPSVSPAALMVPTSGASQKRPAGTPVQVKIVAARPKGGFDVQEEGRPQGTLTVGTPPNPLPQIGDTVAAKVHNDDPHRPQYRWP